MTIRARELFFTMRHNDNNKNDSGKPPQAEKKDAVESAEKVLARNLLEDPKAFPDSFDPSAFIPTPLESISLDKPLPYHVYIKVLNRFVLFRPEGDELSGERVDSLRKQNVDRLFIPESHWDSYLEELEKNTFDDPDADVEKKATGIRSLLLGYQQYLEKKGSLETRDMDRFRDLGQNLVEGIEMNPGVGGKFLRKYNDPLLYFVNHTVNASVYGVVIANKLGLTKDQIKVLTLSILLHNVGNIFIPQHVLQKKGGLTKSEWEQIQQHPIKGAKLLQMSGAPVEVVLTALQHHERMDGQGYPQKLDGNEIHLFAKICSICDVFDALTNHGPYQDALLAQKALERMKQMLGKFDPNILQSLGR